MIRLSVLGGWLAALSTPTADAAGLRETACHLEGFETPVRCVSIEVPLDYAAPDGATATVAAAIAPATTARPAADPLFVLAGGPGQGGTGMAAWLETAFRPARRERDVVLVDLRGTGKAGALACDAPTELTASSGERALASVERCAERYGERVRYYTHREVVEDLERLRAALGYGEINLWGGSFGTRAAQHYVRKYADNVRSVVLDGATPVGRPIFVTAPGTGEQALERLYADCNGDAACAGAFPRLRADLEALLEAAELAPIEGTAPDPHTGKVAPVLLDRDTIVNVLRGALYVGFTRTLIPFAVTAAARGDLAPLAALGAATGEWSTETMALGVTLAVVCSEDAAQSASAEPAELSGGFIRDSYYRGFADMCERWPTAPLPGEMLEPIRTSVPALAISGELDPVTPPSLGEETLAQFATRTHLILPRAYHTNSSNPCAADIIAAFLAEPLAGGRDHACATTAVPKPRFFVGEALR
jgi:pimeloyl-ACP methyl ester carboxylesterase